MCGLLRQYLILTICLALVGYFLYHETITVTKLIGMGACLFGLFLIQK